MTEILNVDTLCQTINDLDIGVVATSENGIVEFVDPHHCEVMSKGQWGVVVGFVIQGYEREVYEYLNALSIRDSMTWNDISNKLSLLGWITNFVHPTMGNGQDPFIIVSMEDMSCRVGVARTVVPLTNDR